MIINRKQAQEAWDLVRGHMSRNAYQDFNIPVGGTVDAATEETVQAAFRAAARQTHPDGGGKMEDFVAVDRAKHVLLHWLKRRPDALPPELAGRCTECDGSGFVRMRGASFGQSLRRQCGRCKGTGDTNYEHEKQCGD